MDSQRPLRVVIAGLGFGAAVHLPVWRSQPGVEVIGLASRRPGKAEAVASEQEISRATQSLEDLMSLSPDIASLALPPDVGAMAAGLALQRGIMVLTEKPIAATLSAAATLAKAARQLSTAVNFSFPELDTFLELKRRIAEGDLGRPNAVEVVWQTESYAHRSRNWGWKTDQARFGGVLSSHASHVVHLGEWLFGPVVSAEAQLDNAATRVFAPPGAIAAWDRATILLHHRDALSCRMLLANGATGMDVHDWTVRCAEGVFRLSKRGPGIMTGFELIRVTTDGTARVVARDIHSDASGGRVLPFRRLIERYIASVRSRAACTPSFKQGLRAQYLLNRIEMAAETATRVACDEDILSA